MKDSFSNELKEDFEKSKKMKEDEFNSIMEESIKKKDNDIISITKSNQNKLKEYNIFENRLIQSTKNKNKYKYKYE